MFGENEDYWTEVAAAIVGVVIVAVVIVFVAARVGGAEPTYCESGDVGAFLYLNHPDSLMRGIRVAEGVPSYGVLYLKEKYGSHNAVPAKEGRKAAAKVVHEQYRKWKAAGCPGTFLNYLGHRFAPVGARNDPYGLNKHWQENVLINAVVHAERRGMR